MSPVDETYNQSVFINIPFDKSYERLFVALIASLISLGRIPHCVLEISERGQGRLNRIVDILKSCQVSAHDLSKVGAPARFNMPFELGLAYSLSRNTQRHSFIIFERKRHRLAITLSDLRGFDPYIHKGSMRGIVNGVLDALSSEENNPDPREVWQFSLNLWKAACRLKQQSGRNDIYNRTLYLKLLSVGLELAIQRGFISP